MTSLAGCAPCRPLWHLLHTVVLAVCLLGATKARAEPSAEAAGESLRGPRRLHLGAEVLVAFLPFSVEPGYGAGLHGRYRLEKDGLFLVGASYSRLGTAAHYEKCRATRCPESGAAITADAELHVLDRTSLPVLDPYVGVRLGPAWSSGNFSSAATVWGYEGPGTTFGLGYDFTVGLDLHLWYAALGIAYRIGGMDEIGYGALAARLQARMF